MAPQAAHGSHLQTAADTSCDDDGHPRRTGTLRSCIAHIITAVIGSGVLSLAWSIAQLGWLGGPFALICFAFVGYISAVLLSDCYRSPHPVTGTRNYSYMDAVRVYLGTKHTLLCGFLQFVDLYSICIAYVITTSTCMGAIQKSNCYHKEGHEAKCASGDGLYMVVFGAIQIILSQIPDLHSIEWLSTVAALMSFSYSFIGLALALAKVIENGRIKGSIGGVAATTAVQKLWLIFQALGDLAFAYPFSIILLEIQDTLRSPPPENSTMKKASMVAISTTTFFYICCGCLGYAAFGSVTPGNLMTGFGFYEPFWLVDFANACIAVHLMGGYQVSGQPIFAFMERWSAKKFPRSRLVNKFYTFEVPFLPAFQVNFLRLCFRTIYVVSTTGVAVIFPYFNEVLGMIGAVNFWPLTVYFPVEMYFVRKKISRWTKKWIVLQIFSSLCFLVTTIAFIGSAQGVIRAKLG
ncbi:probable amino acid permease 7 [Malania oleifera]|uniref:probable amino acid permease 7 n=1 Tax=Malania oleifera TaxID=397392 RepID=UPI0025AE9D6C|nr:probable amino acid permease 7 [Malania oleifera]